MAALTAGRLGRRSSAFNEAVGSKEQEQLRRAPYRLNSTKAPWSVTTTRPSESISCRHQAAAPGWNEGRRPAPHTEQNTAPAEPRQMRRAACLPRGAQRCNNEMPFPLAACHAAPSPSWKAPQGVAQCQPQQARRAGRSAPQGLRQGSHCPSDGIHSPLGPTVSSSMLKCPRSAGWGHAAPAAAVAAAPPPVSAGRACAVGALRCAAAGQPQHAPAVACKRMQAGSMSQTEAPGDRLTTAAHLPPPARRSL